MLITPFDCDGQPDELSLMRLIEHVLASGAHGVAAFGLAGEAHTLTEVERCRLGELILSQVAGRLPVVITVTTESTVVAIRLARHAQQFGAAAIMLAPPSVTRGSSLALVRHYSAVAEAVDLPLIIQDAPSYVGVGLGVALISQLVDRYPNIRLIKTEALPVITAVSELQSKLGTDVGVLSGNGGLYLLDALRYGAKGAIPGCDVPELFVGVYQAYLSGQVEDAVIQFRRILPLLVYQNQSLEFYIACVKAVLAHRGIIANAGLRAPGMMLADCAHAELLRLYSEVIYLR